MDKNIVLNEENETLKLQIKICGFLLLGFLIFGALGVARYFPYGVIFAAITVLTFKLYQYKKTKKVEAAK